MAEGLPPGSCRWLGPSKPRSRRTRGSPPPYPGSSEPQESGEGGADPTPSGFPEGISGDFLCIPKTATLLTAPRRRPLLSAPPPRPRTLGPPTGIAGTPSRDPSHYSCTPQDTKTQLHTPLNQGILPSSPTVVHRNPKSRTRGQQEIVLTSKKPRQQPPLKTRATEPLASQPMTVAP